ncbi:MAG: hypothetical protein FD129_1944 [bacterium]|nr:MAG: hypothetical protein FD129_1944 [bacterium]
MTRTRISLIVPLVLLLGAWGCEDKSSTTPPTPVESARTTESDEMAMWVLGDLEPPAALSERIGADLAAIRARFGDDHPKTVEIDFMLPWEPNRVWLKVDAALYDSVAAALPTSIDAINQRYGGTITRPLYGHGFRWVFIDFDHTINPEGLSEYYIELEGVEFACPSGYIGDWSNVYPAMDPSDRRYLFFEGAGDCPAGCTENSYWYFRMENEEVVLVGMLEYPHAGGEPAWFSEALALRRNYQHHYGRCATRP